MNDKKTILDILQKAGEAKGWVITEDKYMNDVDGTEYIRVKFLGSSVCFDFNKDGKLIDMDCFSG